MKKYIIKYAVMACLSLGLTGTTASCKIGRAHV